MWFRRRRRRQSPPPVLLPALDRLAELVERVVALLGEVAVTAPPPDLPRPPEPPEPHSVRSDLVPAAADGWVAFVASPTGYRLVERDGVPPVRGQVVELDGARFRVLRLGPSPLPGDGRRCAFLEREEPPGEARSFEP